MRTAVGFGAAVDTLVLCQAVDTTEGLAAVVAVEGQVARVHPLVLEKFLAVQEIPAARLARKGLFRSVKLLSAGVIGPRGARGRHLLQLGFFTHLLVGGHRGAFSVLSVICAEGWI